MDATCRLCAENSYNSKSVFSFHKERLISDIITLICPIKIDAADNFSKNICRKCLKTVFEAQELREKSVQSEIKFKSQNFVPKIVNAVSIKQEDQSQSTIVYENELTDSEESSKYFPVNQSSKLQNVKRRIRSNHRLEDDSDEIEDKNYEKEKKSYTCHICGGTFSHTTSNLNRHIKHMHPEYYQSPSPPQLDLVIANLDDDDNSEPTEISKQFFNTKNKQKYLNFIEVINVKGEVFEYQCKICVKNGIEKSWAQNVNNNGTSNIRRHLVIHHKDIFNKFERAEIFELKNRSK